MKYALIILFSSCTTTTVVLDGSRSHAVQGKHLIHTRWRDLNGKAKIEKPDSLVTKAVVTGSTKFELWGEDNSGLTAKDTMEVK